MKITSIVLLTFVLGCHSRQLEIKQLKFGDFEREFIAKNRIDTTYLIAKNPRMKEKYGELIFVSNGDTTVFFNWKFMDVGFVVYDSLGHIAADESMRWEDYKYFYDPQGVLDSIIWRDWDVFLRYSSAYQFYPDSLVLIQKWTERGNLRHIVKYRFNDIGEVIEEEYYEESGRPITYRSYEYEDGKMKIKNEKIFENGQLDSETKISRDLILLYQL